MPRFRESQQDSPFLPQGAPRTAVRNNAQNFASGASGAKDDAHAIRRLARAHAREKGANPRGGTKSPRCLRRQRGDGDASYRKSKLIGFPSLPAVSSKRGMLRIGYGNLCLFQLLYEKVTIGMIFA